MPMKILIVLFVYLVPQFVFSYFEKREEDLKEFHLKILPQPSESQTHGLFEEGGNFCIMADSGGGDSGGGYWNPREQKHAPNLPDQGREQDPDSLEKNGDGWLDQFHRDYEMRVSFRNSKKPVQELDFDIIELLNCENGRGIPISSKDTVVNLLKILALQAFEDGYVDDAKILMEIVLTLTRPEEV